MRTYLKSDDFLAGLLFVAVGIVAIVASRQYGLGTATNMGPGYFPTLLGGLLIFLGGLIMVKGIEAGHTTEDAWAAVPWRSFIVIAAVVLFGLLIERVGFIISGAVLIGVSALASRTSRLWETLLLYVLLSAIVAGVFIYTLGLQISLWIP